MKLVVDVGREGFLQPPYFFLELLHLVAFLAACTVLLLCFWITVLHRLVHLLLTRSRGFN